MEEEEDTRRETAMAATPLLLPNFQSDSISYTQLHKLKELRRRRLQIKKNASSFKKMKGKPNGDRTTMAGDVSATKDIIQTDHQESFIPEGSFPFSKNEDANKVSKKQNAPLPWKKQHKLHWGLDTKERWERKGNM